MKTVREKLYNYEEMPPVEAWDQISHKLPSGAKKQMPPGRRRTRIIAFSTAAAAVIVILIINFIYVKSPNPKTATASELSGISSVPSDSMKENYQILESIIKAPQDKKLMAIHNAEENNNLKYFTIEGPGGEPVKISPKVASLIISADGEFPPKPVWNKKIDKWQHIMLTNDIAPTSTNLIDIIQKASGGME